MFDQQDINTAIEQFDLAAYVEEQGGIEQQRGEYSLTCPSCGKEKLIVNTKKKAWHCWVCQEFEDVLTTNGWVRRATAGTGGVLDLIQAIEELDRKAAAARVLSAGRLTGQDLSILPDLELVDHLGKTKPLWAPPIPYPSNAEPVSGHPRPQWYAQQRGFQLSDVECFGLFWCSDGRYRDRLVFPVYEWGKLVYYQARAMWTPRVGERYIKSLNPPYQEGYAVSTEVLMNLDQAGQFARVCLVEGPADCVKAGPDAVCSFGKAVSDVQVAKLVSRGVKAVDIMLDADAKREAWALSRRLSALFDVRVVNLPFGDPGDYDREFLNVARSQAKAVRQELWL